MEREEDGTVRVGLLDTRSALFLHQLYHHRSVKAGLEVGKKDVVDAGKLGPPMTQQTSVSRAIPA